jgi:mRNA interferase RelE/StbE
VTFILVWKIAAGRSLLKIRAADPAAAKAVRVAVDALADDPAPESSTALGAEGHRRLKLGPYRVLYQVDETSRVIYVLTVGQSRR